MTDEQDPLVRANPVPPGSLDGVPLQQARAELREEIVASIRTSGAPRRSRRWLAPVAAAAAVVLVAGGAWLITLGNDDGQPPAASGSSSAPSDPADREDRDGPRERYQMPPRPVLLRANGWTPDIVQGSDVTWAGPDGATVKVSFFVYGANEDPFALNEGGYARGGTSINVLGEVTRLTDSAARGGPGHVAITSPVIDRDGTALIFEGDGLSRAEFVRVLDTARWTNLRAYDQAIQPAVG